MAFSIGKDSELLASFKEIKTNVNEASLASYYLGISEIPCLIHSPLRKDVKPSFGIFSRDGIRVCWVDFATGRGGSIYSLLPLLWHCTFKEAIDKVHNDMSKFVNTTKISKTTQCNIRSIDSYNKDTDLKCKVRDWKQYDIDYWNSYGVSLDWLKYAEVYPISHKIVIANGHTYTFVADKLAYAFVERKEGNITLKIYQPYNKDGYKWSNKHDKSVISLWTKIPETGNKVCICSSLKDALCLWSNTGIPAIAVQGEGYSMSETAISELKRRFKQVYILFDNDDAGLADGKKLASQTGFINVILPNFKEGKDISDLYKAKGKIMFCNIIQSLFDDHIEDIKDDNPFDLPF